MGNRWVTGAFLVAWAAAAAAADAPPATQAPAARAGGSRSSLRASCNELIRSQARLRRGGNSELERACADLVRSEARRGGRAPDVQPGVRAGPLAPGEPALAASEPGRNPSLGTVAPLPGARSAGAAGPMTAASTAATPFENLIDSDIVGTLNGDGINAEYSRMYDEQLSLVGRARYSRTNAAGAAATEVGLGAGFDYFLSGGNNQGLRVGPRLEASFGSNSRVGTTNDFGRLSVLGEIGYNLIATSGLTGVLSGGFDLRVAGAQGTDVGFNASGNFSPYLRVGVGYSW